MIKSASAMESPTYASRMFSSQNFFDGFAVFHFDKRGILMPVLSGKIRKYVHELWE
jgi:hypothetical protein